MAGHLLATVGKNDLESSATHRATSGPLDLGYLTGVYHVASSLRATTECCHSVVTAISSRHRFSYGCVQPFQATRKVSYPDLFVVVGGGFVEEVVVVAVVVVTGVVVVVTGVVEEVVVVVVVVVVDVVVVVTGATWFLTVSTTGWGG